MTEAYKIGITVAMTNLLTAELGRIGASLMGVHNQAKGLEVTLATIGKIGLGVGVVGAIAAIAAGVDEARKFQTEAAKFATLGFGDAINSQARRFAEGMDTLGTSATENMALVSDAMAVFKDLDHAKMAAPLMSKMKFANSAIYGESGGANDRKFMDMLKVVEFRGGLSSDKEFSTQADYVQKVINGSRNRVDAGQLLQALKTGGIALSRLGNEAFYLGSEPLIQEFGGSRYGTANMSAYQNLVMMRTTQQVLTELMRLNLLDKSKVEMNTYTGKVKRAKAGAFIGSGVLEQEGDLAFLEKVLLPAFAAKGITSDDDVITEIGRIFSNRTASGLFSRIYQQRGILHTQINANKSAMGIAGTEAAADATYDGKMVELHTQWRNVLRNLGDEVLPSAIWGIDKLAGGLKYINELFGWKHGIESNIKDAHAGTLGGSVDWWKSNLGMGGSAVPPPAKKETTIHTVLNVDGINLAKAVTRYQVNGLATMPQSGSLFDGRMHLAPVQ